MAVCRFKRGTLFYAQCPGPIGATCMPSWAALLVRKIPQNTAAGLPYTTPHCLPPAPYEVLTANRILGPRRAHILCKIKTKWPK